MGFFSSKPKPQIITFVNIYVCLNGEFCDLVTDKDCQINGVPAVEWGCNYQFYRTGYDRNDPPLALLCVFFRGYIWYITNTALQVRLFKREMTEEEIAQRKAAAKVK